MFDCIVLGLGGMGSAAAFHLAKRGRRVLGLEQFGMAHDRGSSHGYSRVIRQAYFEHPAYVPLLLRAYELWRELESESALELLTVTGGLMIGPPDSPVFLGSQASARQHGLPHEILDAKEIRRRFPAFTPSREIVALYERAAGIVRPEAAVRAHLNCAVTHGAELHFDEPVISWRATSNAVEVQTARATYHAEQLVIAPGAWGPHMFQLALPLTVTLQTLFWFEPIGGLEPFLPDRFPIYIWQSAPGDEFYGFPAQIEPNVPGGVKVAYFYRDARVDPDAPRADVTLDEIEAMRSALRERIPNLNGKLLLTRSCLYTETPDHHFVIGRHPLHTPVLVASPCSGHGYKFCSVIGEILSDLVINGSTPHPVDLFAINRWSLFN